MKKWQILNRTVIYYLLVLIFLRLAFGPFAWYFSRSIFFADVTSDVLLDLVNSTREDERLSPLKISDQLNLAAYQKARDMIDNQYFAHYSPGGISPWCWFSQVGYQYYYAGENLAIHFFDSAEVHEAWMSSSSHRANILNPNYQEMGLAVVTGYFEGQETAIVVQLFGTPRQLTEYQPSNEPAQVIEIQEILSEPEIVVEQIPVEIVAIVDQESLPEEDAIVDYPEEESPIELPEKDLVELNLAPETNFPDGELRLLGSSSVATTELLDNNWIKLFKFISRNYEQTMQQLFFYGIILISLYFGISIIKEPTTDAIKVCGQTTLWVLLVLFLSFFTKDFILRWISSQIIIG